MPDWASGWPKISLLVRQYDLSNEQIKEINGDEVIQATIKRVHGEDKVQKGKYHWRSMEVAQGPVGSFLDEWPNSIQLDRNHHGIWIAVVFED